MKDFTTAQAERWVAQELAKHTTVASICGRLASETEMMAMGDGFGLPNSYAAHKALHAELTARLNSLVSGTK